MAAAVADTYANTHTHTHSHTHAPTHTLETITSPLRPDIPCTI